MKISLSRRTITIAVIAFVAVIGLVVVVTRLNARKVLLSENFDSPETVKPYLARQDFFAEEGRLKVTIGTPATGCSTFVPGQYENFVLETQVFPLGDIADASTNFVFRYNDKGWYEVWLRPSTHQAQFLKFAQDGQGNVQGMQSLSNGWLDVPEDVFSPALNQVRLSAKGNVFTVWVNNRQVLQFTDSETPYLSGKIQIGAGTGEVGGIAFAFDDLQIFDR